MKARFPAPLCFSLLGLLACSAPALAGRVCPPGLEADSPAAPDSIEQVDINTGALDFPDVIEHGGKLFTTKFNVCDGRGRPETTGGGEKRPVPTVSREGEVLEAGQVGKLRTSAPDSDSCAGCHNDPAPGGGGDFVSNVFVLAQNLDPVTQSVSPTRSNSRNTLGMHGAGPIEMLAREMTASLKAQREGLPDGVHTLAAKSVEFKIEIRGGELVAAEGVDHDLVIRPFHQSGSVVSLREFTVNAMNHHHGMQAEERFDLNALKGFDPDFDNDGVERELSIGDITAVVLWQAQLPTPQQALPKKRVDRMRAEHGEAVFSAIGCAGCHVPSMILDSPMFVEPNPYNPAGTCAGAGEGCPEYSFDMTRDAAPPRLKEQSTGAVVVRAYTDLKRHNLCDDPGPDAIRWFCNEQLAQGRAAQDGKPGTEFFLTRKLWDVGSSAPYGHRGDISTITEAILLHGGEGRGARDNFVSRPIEDQRALVDFLKTLQIQSRSLPAH